jgi:hypothetical protein
LVLSLVDEDSFVVLVFDLETFSLPFPAENFRFSGKPEVHHQQTGNSQPETEVKKSPNQKLIPQMNPHLLKTKPKEIVELLIPMNG